MSSWTNVKLDKCQVGQMSVRQTLVLLRSDRQELHYQQQKQQQKQPYQQQRQQKPNNNKNVIIAQLTSRTF
jgi:hypothetical protein